MVCRTGPCCRSRSMMRRAGPCYRPRGMRSTRRLGRPCRASVAARTATGMTTPGSGECCRAECRAGDSDECEFHEVVVHNAPSLSVFEVCRRAHLALTSSKAARMSVSDKPFLGKYFQPVSGINRLSFIAQVATDFNFRPEDRYHADIDFLANLKRMAAHRHPNPYGRDAHAAVANHRGLHPPCEYGIILLATNYKLIRKTCSQQICT